MTTTPVVEITRTPPSRRQGRGRRRTTTFSMIVACVALLCLTGPFSRIATTTTVSAFAPAPTTVRSRPRSALDDARIPFADDDDSCDESRWWSRRDVLVGSTTSSVVGLATLLPWPGSGGEAVAAASSSIGPVAVVGASGRTGSLCVTACLRRGIPAKALTRTGEWTAPPTPPGAIDAEGGGKVPEGKLSVVACDVAKVSSDELTDLFRGCSAVVYAASASKKGGTAKVVDNEGVARVASAAVAAGVPRCVVISSTATTRPKSLGYVFTNLGVGGNIMGEKRNGELAVASAYAAGASSSSYTIVRPGGLEEAKRNSVLGPSSVELSQGDVFSGIVSRADVAEVTVELALSNAANLRNTAVEVYYAESVVEVEGRFKPLLAAAKREGGGPERKLLRLRGSTYPELLSGIRPGIDFATSDDGGVGGGGA